MTTGKSMQAIILTAPPHSRQVSMSISPQALTFVEHPLETFPPGEYFWYAPLIEKLRPGTGREGGLGRREPGHLVHLGIERLIAGRQRLQGEQLAALLRADSDADL